MKKRIFALACALILVFGMNVTAFAANSPSADVIADASQLMESSATSTRATTATRADGTAVGVNVDKVASVDIVIGAKTEAAAKVGTNAQVVSVVDVTVDGGGEATITLTNPAIKAGQTIKILHKKADGTWETITPSSVVDGAVTFTMTDYSPVAIVVEADSAAASTATAASAAPAATSTAAATAPKTGDMSMMVSAMAVICLAGVVIFGKKAKLN